MVFDHVPELWNKNHLTTIIIPCLLKKINWNVECVTTEPLVELIAKNGLVKTKETKLKDNGCIATCINCTNGGNQGQSGGDRSLNQPRPYQNAVKCSQCHRIANGTQQMESYFSKKQRSKSKQGKSCVCIGCTTKNNKQWGH